MDEKVYMSTQKWKMKKRMEKIGATVPTTVWNLCETMRMAYGVLLLAIGYGPIYGYGWQIKGKRDTADVDIT